jgi:hypothetical protein
MHWMHGGKKCVKLVPCTGSSSPQSPNDLWTPLSSNDPQSLSSPVSRHSVIVQLQPPFRFVIRDPPTHRHRLTRSLEQYDDTPFIPSAVCTLQSPSPPRFVFLALCTGLLNSATREAIRVISVLALIDCYCSLLDTPAIRSLSRPYPSPHKTIWMYSVSMTPP